MLKLVLVIKKIKKMKKERAVTLISFSHLSDGSIRDYNQLSLKKLKLLASQLKISIVNLHKFGKR